MLQSAEQFVNFLDGMHKRTMMYVQAVPNYLLDWRPADQKFSTGELLRHIGSAQLMFLGILERGEWKYSGHDRNKGQNVEEISEYLEECYHKLRTGILARGDELFQKRLPTVQGREVSSWRIMMALVEHEIHHRGQFSTYLQSNGIEPPQIFGVKIEQVEQE